MNPIGFIFVILFAVSCNSSYIDELLIKNQNLIVNGPNQGLETSIVGDDLLKILVYLFRMADIPTAFSNRTSEQCKKDSILYLRESIKITPKPWASAMLESSGKIPQALHAPDHPNIHSYGLFDECLSIRVNERDNLLRKHIFQGKYCSVYYRPVAAIMKASESETSVQEKLENRVGKNWNTIFQLLKLSNASIDAEPQDGDTNFVDPFLFSNGFCLPSSCSSTDLRKAIADLVGDFALSFDNNKTFTSILTASDENQCYIQSDETPEFDGADIAMIVILSTIAFVVTAATIHELVRIILKRPVNEESGYAVRSLHCFSALNNIRKLVSTKKSSDDLSCIHGIRFLSTTWVITGHTWMQSTNGDLTTFMAYKDAITWPLLAITNATVSVDTFFTMSGMLVSYLLLRELHRNKGKFNILLFYIHRYLRLTPVYAVILGFLATLVVYCGMGPSWSAVRMLSHGCRGGWWYNLLYINNLVELKADTSCMGETWYMANDMQFFLISPFLIYPIWRWKSYGYVRFAPLFILTLASLVANIDVFAVYDFPMTTFITRSDISLQEQLDYMTMVYVKPWLRAPPYFVGIFFGWLLYETKKTNYKLNKNFVYACWAFAAATALAIIYGLYPYVDQNKTPEINQVANVLYGSLHRFAWAIVVCWVIYACVFGYAGMVNDLLSWSAFTPLSRLSYCVYLIHLNYITVYVSHSRTLFYYTTIDQIHRYFGILLVAYGFAFIASIAVEVPFLNLEKLVFSSNRRPVKENDADAENPKINEINEQITSDIPKGQ